MSTDAKTENQVVEYLKILLWLGEYQKWIKLFFRCWWWMSIHSN